MRAREFLRGITPPYLARAIHDFRTRKRPPRWELLGTTWVDGTGEGWNAATVAERYAGKLDTFRAAIAAPSCIGVPTEALSPCAPSPYDQNVALGYAYAVARATRGRTRTSILDWGGGFGFMGLVARELFPAVEIDFHVKEVPETARAGREHVTDVTFWEDETCFDRSYDLASACGSLQYSPDWRGVLTRLGAAAPFLFLTRTPVAATPQSYVVRQHAYDTSYESWVFSRDELLSAAAATGLVLEREFLEGWSAEVPGAPAPDEARGYLFSRAATGGPEPRA